MLQNLILLFALSLPLAAQSGVDITTNQDGGHTLTNNSGKVILLVAGVNSFTITPAKENPDGTVIPAVTSSVPFAHEYLFKQGGMAPSSSFVMDRDPNPSVAVPDPSVTFVQFADGSQWGDSKSASAQAALSVREAELAFLPSLTVGAESEFSAALAAPQTDPVMQMKQRKYQQIVKESGVSGALAQAKARFAAAQQSSNLWKF